MPAVHAGEDKACDDAADPEQHERYGNHVGRERGDTAKEWLDIAVHREVSCRKECRHNIDTCKRRLTDEGRKRTDGEPFSW